MKRIKNEKVLNPFNGVPLEVTYDFIKDADGDPVLDKLGNPKPVKCDLTTAIAIRQFISTGFDPKETTFDDSDHALRILAVLRPFKLLEKALGFEPPKYISLEDAEHKWLIDEYKKRGPKIHGVLTRVYLDAFEDVEKIEVHKDAPESEKPRLVKSGK